MSFKDTLSWIDQLISRKMISFIIRWKITQDQLEPFSGRESQDIYCWLEKFENQFKSCGRKLDPACLAATLACNLTGLAETFYFSLEPEVRNDFDLLSTAFKSRFFQTIWNGVWNQSLISRQQGSSESLDSYIDFIDSSCRRLGVSQVDRVDYFVNGLREGFDGSTERLSHSS